jgi:hypothetical protein
MHICHTFSQLARSYRRAAFVIKSNITHNYLLWTKCIRRSEDKIRDSSVYLLTELRPSSGAINWAATQEIPSISRNQKIQYRIHKSSPLVPIQSPINPIHTIPSHPISLRSILILNTHLRLRLPSGLFPSGSPTNIL